MVQHKHATTTFLKYTAYSRALLKQAQFQFWAALIFLAFLNAAGTHHVEEDVRSLSSATGQFSLVHVAPVVIAYMRHVRVHRQEFKPKPRRKGVPV